MLEENFSISKTIKSNPKINGLLFVKMKDKILGKKYSLSLVFVGKKKSQYLNNKYRKKNKPTDILSFPIAPNEGEIFINLEETTKKAKLHRKTNENYLNFLFIHGLVHLKGFDHGSRMESEEQKFRKFFGV